MKTERSSVNERIIIRARFINQLREEGWELEAASVEADRMMKEISALKSAEYGD
jgi:hypothetical protein